MKKNMNQESMARPWGAHVSISGGVDKAPARGQAIGAKAIQIFTKSNARWNAPSITPAQASAFASDSARSGVRVIASHVCYLLNLASPDAGMLKKSREAFLDEMDRADLLSIPYLVFHPGAHMGAGEEDGLKRAAESLKWAMANRPDSKVILALETTAGQGTSIGHRFRQLGAIIKLAGEGGRLGVCVDTCHIFAAGYGLADKKEYAATMAELDSEIGLERIGLFHLNDSKKPQGSRVDRHEHIGQGFIGREGFRLLVNDARHKNIPMILETPKGPEGLEDIRNLKILRGLIQR